ncbi:MAG TPA: hypothetical protein DCQ64_03665 [Candidatus Rokubacteria bacterium]|nr:hypothetical protein [Candidatus Rokubacteria bacterium]
MTDDRELLWMAVGWLHANAKDDEGRLEPLIAAIERAAIRLGKGCQCIYCRRQDPEGRCMNAEGSR